MTDPHSGPHAAVHRTERRERTRRAMLRGAQAPHLRLALLCVCSLLVGHCHGMYMRPARIVCAGLLRRRQRPSVPAGMRRWRPEVVRQEVGVAGRRRHKICGLLLNLGNFQAGRRQGVLRRGYAHGWLRLQPGGSVQLREGRRKAGLWCVGVLEHACVVVVREVRVRKARLGSCAALPGGRSLQQRAASL